MWELISAYLSNVISMVGVLFFGKIISKNTSEISSKKKFLLFELVCILQTIAFLNFNGTLKTLIMLLNNVLLYKYVFNCPTLKSIFMTFLCMLLFTIPDVLIIIIATKIFGISEKYYYNVFAGSLLANFTVVTVFMIQTLILKKFLKKLVNIRIEENIKLVIYYILTFICISIFFYKAFYNIGLTIDFIASIFVMLAFLTILFSLIKQTLDNNKIKEDYDKLLEFMTTYENEIEKQRILRHETKNEFLTIRAKICDNQKNKEIVSYIDEILKDKIKVNQEKYAKFGYLPPNGIKGLCYFKVQEAEEKNINIALNISKRIKDSTIFKLNIKQQREFGRILGVILDNAIESCVISKEKKMGIEAYTNSNKEFKIIISNTFNNNIDQSKIGIERFSTKGKNRGHGLLLVKHIISQNKIFNLETNIQDNIYTQTIIIKKDIDE